MIENTRNNTKVALYWEIKGKELRKSTIIRPVGLNKLLEQ